MSRFFLLFLALICAGALVLVGWLRPAPAPEAKATPLPSHNTSQIQGVTFDAWAKPPAETFTQLRQHGITHLSVTPFGWQEAYNSPEVKLRTEARYYTEGDTGIAELAAQGQKYGLKIILKPHIWLSNSAAEEFYQGKKVIKKKWRDAIAFENEADWQRWSSTYRNFMMHYARLAERIGADVLCIGTELASTVRQRPDFWRGLIRDVRAVYSGKLTYGANWYKEYEEVTFWDELDFIGIQAYFPVSKKPNPTLEDLLTGWKKHHDAIAAIQEKTGKPVLFTEIGYRSVSFAAEKPWHWPNRSEVGNIQPDFTLQANLYEAFFQTFWNKPWTAGALIWKWYPEGSRRASRRAIDFTPQEKPAADVLSKWYGAPPER